MIESGINLEQIIVIQDIEKIIIDNVIKFSEKYSYVFTTGGIGPTHDAITAESVSEAVGRKLIQNPEARRRLEEHYKFIGTEINAARTSMANTPEGAELIDNPISTAPGFKIENVHVMAGVPRIMQAMMDNITGSLEGGATKLSCSILCNLGEGTIASGLSDIQGRFPEIDIGSYPHYARGDYRLSLVIRGFDETELEEAQQAVFDMITDLGGDPIKGKDTESA